MRVLLYCQHVLGIGHFFRSMAIAEALAGHEVLFVEGGEPLTGFEPPAHVKRFMLPPLMMDAAFDRLHAQSDDLDAVKAARREMLLGSWRDFGPHVLVTELFPFGRNAFRFELIPLLEAIRLEKQPTRVLCSLRDILVEKPDPTTYEERVLSRLNTFYDAVLVHSDPRLFSLEDTFARAGSIRPPIHYTGYVVRGRPVSSQAMHAVEATRAILVSAGGGRVGIDLLVACLEAMRLLDDEDLRMRLLLGPFVDPADRAALEPLASRDPRTTLCPFSPDFATELRGAALSISMAGYNTCMDLIAARPRALVYPFPQNREQSMRAARLEALGLVQSLTSLAPEDLARAIARALSRPAPKELPDLDLGGARTTARLVERYGATAVER